MTTLPTESAAINRPRGCPGETRGHRRKVVLLARNLLVGGAERVFLHYANRLASLDPVVFLLRDEGPLRAELDPAIPYYFSKGSGLAVSGQWTSDPAGVTSLRALVGEARRLSDVVEQSDASLVSSFLMRSHIVALLAKAWNPGLRVVLNIHEHMSQSATHLYPSRLDRRLMRLITRYGFPSADRIVTVADGVKDDLIENFGLKPDRISVVHNPIDTEKIRRLAGAPLDDPFLEDQDGPVIMAVGRLVKLKGLDVLLRAFARLPERLQARLVIVGPGPERAALLSLAGELGVEGRLRLVGMERNPWKYLARADLYVLSSHTEAFPNTIGEALALKVPVVAVDCSPGVAEYLQNGECGLLLEPNDEAELARGMERMLSDRALREGFVQRGLIRVNEFGLPGVVRRYEQLLLDVIDSP